MLGMEYRPTFWINIYNRLRHLDFSDLPECAHYIADQRLIKRKVSLDSKLIETINDESEEKSDFSLEDI